MNIIELLNKGYIIELKDTDRWFVNNFGEKVIIAYYRNEMYRPLPVLVYRVGYKPTELIKKYTKDKYMVLGFDLKTDYLFSIVSLNLRTKEICNIVGELGVSVEVLVKNVEKVECKDNLILNLKLKLMYEVDIDSLGIRYSSLEELYNVIYITISNLKESLSREKGNVYYIGDKIKYKEEIYEIIQLFCYKDTYSLLLESKDETDWITIKDLNDIELVIRSKENHLVFNTTTMRKLGVVGKMIYNSIIE